MGTLKPANFPADSVPFRDNDRQAVAHFLAQRNAAGEMKYVANTLSAYDKECRRLLLFCEQQDKHFQTLTVADAHHYVCWLKNPPASQVSAIRKPMDDPGWKPFAGPLSPASVKHGIDVINSLFRWLQQLGYLHLNVFGFLDTNTRERRLSEAARKHRVLLLEDIHSILSYLNEQDRLSQHDTRSSRKLQRQRWLFHAYLYSGMRLSELLALDTRALAAQQLNGEQVWTLRVTGKGGKVITLPVAERFAVEYHRYRAGLGLSPLPPAHAPEPLLFSLTGRQPITSRQSVHALFKALTSAVADHQQALGNHVAAARIRKSSTHWLRHSFVTLALDVSQDLPAVAELARHSDVNTTLKYDKSRYSHLVDILEGIVETLNTPESAQAVTSTS